MLAPLCLLLCALILCLVSDAVSGVEYAGHAADGMVWGMILGIGAVSIALLGSAGLYLWLQRQDWVPRLLSTAVSAGFGVALLLGGLNAIWLGAL